MRVEPVAPLGSGRQRRGRGRKEMKHFSTTEWIDFVSHVVTGNQQEAMQKHLATGCKRCTETVSLWQKVSKTATAEASYQPPPHTVRLAKAAFATSGRALPQKESRGVIEVLFDSFLQPAVAGARSLAIGTRQMLYRADPYQIDIQIEPKQGSNRLVITGQLLDLSHPRIIGREIQVALSNRSGSTVMAATNQFGEFSGEIENSGDIELTIPGEGEKPIVISLRNALGNLHGGKP
jgi:hypothetical protein